MDPIGPFTRTQKGHVYALTVTDLFTKWVVGVPLKKSSAEVSKALVDTFYMYGAPKKIITDHGREFVNQVHTIFSI